MAMGRRKKVRQQEFWIPAEQIARGPGHPFYEKLNALLDQRGFDAYVEGVCEKFYHDDLGRPGVPPGVYFRMLLVGYFEGIDSERGIDWRCGDSLTLRSFLGCDIKESTPDHSTLCTVRKRIDIETHRSVFTWVLALVADSGLLKGQTLGIDATTLEANAAMRSIVRRDSGDSYQQFLEQLAKASGIETPTREDLARVDKSRKKKASNDDWEHPHDPDAKITKMKDGRTHLAHKAEHAMDLETGAIVAVTVQPANRGDTASLNETLFEAVEMLLDAGDHGAKVGLPEEVVGDKGYHSNGTCRGLREMGFRTYFSEPARGRRDWKGKASERDAVYGNRRRIRGERGKRLLRKRGELVERPFAHCYETGGMRRTHLRGHLNILKRLLIHTAGFNLALVLRKAFGVGTPRALQDGLKRLLSGILGALAEFQALLPALQWHLTPQRALPIRISRRHSHYAAA